MLVGAAIPAVFSAMLIMGVNRSSQLMVKEIHRQFKEIPGLRKAPANRIMRAASIFPRWAPSVNGPRSLIQPLPPRCLVGFIGGVQAIGGYLTGNIISGLLLALFDEQCGRPVGQREKVH